MKLLADIYFAVPGFVWQLLSWAGTVFAVLFIHFSSRYRNTRLHFMWYVFAIILPFPALLVYFFSERRKHKQIEVKVCESCGKMHPLTFSYCTDCLAELPDFKPEKKKLQKSLAILFICLFAVVSVVNAASSVVTITSVLEGYEVDADEGESRISFKDADGADVYYDRNGEKYYDLLEVQLFDREGICYYYTYDGGDCFYKDDGTVTLWEEDRLLDADCCYVDKEGYFVDLSNMPELVKIIESENTQYYFETPFTDGKGNIYYPAMSASWNEQGQLITSADMLVN